MSIAYDSPIPYDEPQSYNFGGSFGASGVLPLVLPHLNAVMQLQGDGTFAFWQQGTIDEVAQCVEVICGTTIGDRTVVPGFGIPDIVFTLPSPQHVIEKAIEAWEQRAVSTVVIKNAGGDETIQVNTSLRKGSSNNL